MSFVKWANLSIEPILGSGEFINAGVVVQIEGRLEYFPILDERKCSYLFGTNGQKLYQNVELSISALRSLNLAHGGDVVFPISGARLSAFRAAIAESLPAFIASLKQYSFLGHASFEESLNNNSKEITRERFLAKFIQDIKIDLCSVSRNYSKFFKVEYDLPNVSYPVKYGFSTPAYVANFSYVHPGPYLNGMMKNTTYKMVELSLLHQAEIASKPTDFELILHMPTIYTPSSSDDERFLKETEKLTVFAKDNGIRIFSTQEVKGTVSHLIAKIVA